MVYNQFYRYSTQLPVTRINLPNNFKSIPHESKKLLTNNFYSEILSFYFISVSLLTSFSKCSKRFS